MIHLNFRFWNSQNNKRPPERAAGAKILSFLAFIGGFPSKNITVFMLISDTFISPKFRHANKRYIEFQKLEFLHANKRPP